VDASTYNQAVESIASACIAVRLRLLNRVVTNIFDDALRPLGLKASQLNILVAAVKLGVARPARMCELLKLDPSTLSRAVDRMISNGWLVIGP
jgi:DNA-binding MarR family transcriptional regulator